MNIESLLDMPRRDVLCVLDRALEENKTLSDVAGKNTLVDCTLYLLAKGDSQKESNLKKYVSIEELIGDIGHLQMQKSIRSKRKEMLENYAWF